MSHKSTGGALVLVGLAPYGLEVLGLIGGDPAGVDPLFLLHGILIVFLGSGVYADEIQFEQESATKYEALIFLFAIGVIIVMIGGVFIAVS